MCTEFQAEFPWCATKVDHTGFMVGEKAQCGANCEKPCECTRKLEPVCGHDGKQYDNPCDAECAGASINCHASCPCVARSKTWWSVFGLWQCCVLERCYCPDKWEPVCGANAITYKTECWAKCNNIKVVCQGACPCQNEKANQVELSKPQTNLNAISSGAINVDEGIKGAWMKARGASWWRFSWV